MQKNKALDCSGLIWDTCTLLNLAATGCPDEILISLGRPSYVVEAVRETEVLYLRPGTDGSTTAERLPVDLAPLLASGLLQDVSLTETERETFVHLAQRLDDGESMTLAIAQHRGLWMVTDERVVIRLSESGEIAVPMLTTPGWLKHWADQCVGSPSEISNAIINVQDRANYRPFKDPLAEWWHSHRAPTGAWSI